MDIRLPSGVALRGGTQSADVVAYCDSWFAEVEGAGYTTGVYVGSETGLTGDRSFRQLKTKHYRKSGSSALVPSDHMSPRMNRSKPPTQRDMKREDTRARLFAAALDEFRRVGVDQARVSEICRNAGVAKGTFFFHFATKDHVLLERQQQISGRMASRIEAELSNVPDAKTFVQRLAAIVIEEHKAVGDPELVRQINLAIVRQSGAPRLGIAHTAFGVALAAQIHRHQQAGILRKGIDAARLADCLRLGFFGFLVAPDAGVDTTRPRLALLAGLLAESLAPKR